MKINMSTVEGCVNSTDKGIVVTMTLRPEEARRFVSGLAEVFRQYYYNPGTLADALADVVIELGGADLEINMELVGGDN